MVKYIKVVEARLMRCPTLNQTCAGIDCMAFKYKTYTKPKEEAPDSMFLPPSAYRELVTDTSYGYCGMVD